jgi:hypothetical protein
MDGSAATQRLQIFTLGPGKTARGSAKNPLSLVARVERASRKRRRGSRRSVRRICDSRSASRRPTPISRADVVIRTGCAGDAGDDVTRVMTFQSSRTSETPGPTRRFGVPIRFFRSRPCKRRGEDREDERRSSVSRVAVRILPGEAESTDRGKRVTAGSIHRALRRGLWAIPNSTNHSNLTVSGRRRIELSGQVGPFHNQSIAEPADSNHHHPLHYTLSYLMYPNSTSLSNP